MTDWNGDGSYDVSDSYLDYQLGCGDDSSSGGGSHHSGGGGGGTIVRIVIGEMIVLFILLYITGSEVIMNIMSFILLIAVFYGIAFVLSVMF